MKIIKNMGKLDRIIRLIVSTVLVVLIATQNFTGIIAVVAGIIAIVLFATSIVSFCGLYTLLGINTCKIAPKKK